MTEVLNKDGVTIWHAPAGTVGADLSTAGTKLGYVTSRDSSGFEQDSDQINVFDGAVASKKPVTQIEETFEVLVTSDTDRDVPMKIKMGEIDIGMIAIQKQISATEFLWEAVNNVSSASMTSNNTADDNWKATLMFKATALTKDGKHNYDFGTNDIEDAVNGLISGNPRTIDGVERSNSW